jgi:TonB family protein
MRNRRWLVSISLVIHVVVVAALFVAGTWRIERLDAATPPFHVGVVLDPPQSSSSGAQATVTEVKLIPKKHITNRIVPPTVKPDPTPDPVAEVGTGGGSGDGSGSGSGSGSGDGSGSGSGECQFPPCAPPEVPATPPPPPLKPRFVSISALKRISGDTQIQPPDITKIQMSRDGISKATATFTICLDANGALTSIKLAHPSGYSGYDERLAEGIRAWRYQPFMLDGKGAPVCSAVTFIYRIN